MNTPVTKDELLNRLKKIERWIKRGRDGKNKIRAFNTLSAAKAETMMLRQDIVGYGLRP